MMNKKSSLMNTRKDTPSPIRDPPQLEAATSAQMKMKTVRGRQNVAVTVVFDDSNEVDWQDKHLTITEFFSGAPLGTDNLCKKKKIDTVKNSR